MKSLFYFLILISHLTMAQTNNSWNGNFKGTILNVSCQLTGDVDQNIWTGTINADGYIYELKGNLDVQSCKGTFSDPQTGATAPFEAVIDGQTINIVVQYNDPYSGQTQPIELVFSKNTFTAPPTTQRAKPDASNLDPSVIGRWRRTETYTSGDFTMATDYFAQFDPDGTAWYTDGQSAGGGSNSSIVSKGGNTHQASWKTENQILYAKDDTSGWVPYARYYIEGNSLMLTFNDGSRQIWEKL